MPPRLFLRGCSFRTLASSSEKSRRNLWTAVTLSSGSAEAVEAATLAQLSTHHGHSNILAALSDSLPPNVLSSIVSRLQRGEDKTTSVIGCLSHAAIPSQRYSVSLAFFSPEPSTSPSSRIVPFRSTIKGRPRIALGREIRPELMSARDGGGDFAANLDAAVGSDWADMWGAEGGGMGTGSVPELEGLEYVSSKRGGGKDFRKAHYVVVNFTMK
jgi:hypothetical protein